MLQAIVDAYTFIVRGNTLVAGQTGNVVFLSVGIVQRNLADAEIKILTLLSFMLGVFFAYDLQGKLRIC